MISKEERDTGRFFGEIDWLVMDSLIHYGVYKRYDNITVKPLLLSSFYYILVAIGFFFLQSPHLRLSGCLQGYARAPECCQLLVNPITLHEVVRSMDGWPRFLVNAPNSNCSFDQSRLGLEYGTRTSGLPLRG